jgi:NTE family protein
MMRALVLSGGGARGAYQIGALRRLLVEERREYEILAGVSVGALNAAFLAHAPMGQIADRFAELEKLWAGLETSRIYRKRPGGEAAGLWSLSIFDSSPLVELVTKTIEPARVRASGRKLRVGAVNLETGEYRSATETDPRLGWWVLASSSFPVFFLPIKIDGQLWTDGGVRNVTPLAEAIRLGADRIDVVICSNPDVGGSWSAEGERAIPGFLLRCLGLLSDEVARTDLQVAGLKNDLAKLCDRYKAIRFRVVQPSTSMPDSLDFSAGPRQTMIDMGYEDARTLAATRSDGNPNE